MISCDVKINFGQPALRGRRLTVYDIVTKVYYEDGVKVAIDDYEILIQDAKEAVEYCRHLKCKKDVSLVHFCDGCVLRTIQEGWGFNKEDYVELKEGEIKLVKSKDNQMVFIGSLQELE